MSVSHARLYLGRLDGTAVSFVHMEVSNARRFRLGLKGVVQLKRNVDSFEACFTLAM